MIRELKHKENDQEQELIKQQKANKKTSKHLETHFKSN